MDADQSFTRSGRFEALLYLAVGGATFVIDFGSFFVLLRVLNVGPLVSAAAGYWLSFAFNFLANKYLTFGRRGRVSGQLFRYAFLVGANFLFNLLVVHLFVTTGWSPLLGKIIAVATLTVVNFFAYRLWVFRRRD